VPSFTYSFIQQLEKYNYCIMVMKEWRQHNSTIHTIKTQPYIRSNQRYGRSICKLNQKYYTQYQSIDIGNQSRSRRSLGNVHGLLIWPKITGELFRTSQVQMFQTAIMFINQLSPLNVITMKQFNLHTCRELIQSTNTGECDQHTN